ncbi:MAG: 4-hydroxy-3-methylbut-2-enyl diphosphate reductase [Lentimicrobium sp.]|nr:4-hydroxy-3-methylbut-2-enyl diphosphate reductase [Lentimicrobium sp.]
MNNSIPQIEIDLTSGFCSGVNRAIRFAEEKLEQGEQLQCLGKLIHNDTELERLRKKGMTTINHTEIGTGNQVAFIRTHGEPPETYNLLNKYNQSFLDATCPFVQRLQQKVKKSSILLSSSGKGRVVIFGKKEHPEVVGLLGQSTGNDVVVEGFEDVKLLNFDEPLHVFAQTTADDQLYQEICRFIKETSFQITGNPDNVKIINSICRQMSRRVPELKEFARRNDIIIFVSGVDSSNGKFLAGISHEVNPRTYVVENASQVGDWFDVTDRIGISGATSTPHYQLQEVADFIYNKFKIK